MQLTGGASKPVPRQLVRTCHQPADQIRQRRQAAPAQDLHPEFVVADDQPKHPRQCGMGAQHAPNGVHRRTQRRIKLLSAQGAAVTRQKVEVTEIVQREGRLVLPVDHDTVAWVVPPVFFQEGSLRFGQSGERLRQTIDPILGDELPLAHANFPIGCVIPYRPASTLRRDRAQLSGGLRHPPVVPHVVGQHELVAVPVPDESALLPNDRTGNQGRSQHPVILVQQNRRQRIERGLYI